MSILLDNRKHCNRECYLMPLWARVLWTVWRVVEFQMPACTVSGKPRLALQSALSIYCTLLHHTALHASSRGVNLSSTCQVQFSDSDVKQVLHGSNHDDSDPGDFTRMSQLLPSLGRRIQRLLLVFIIYQTYPFLIKLYCTLCFSNCYLNLKT
jgi:hypothetical protein